MMLNYDTMLTTFWWGVACINVLLWLLDRITLLSSIIFWFAIFPVLERIVREVCRHYFALHPGRLWGLACIACGPYLLLVGLFVWLYRRTRKRNRA